MPTACDGAKYLLPQFASRVPKNVLHFVNGNAVSSTTSATVWLYGFTSFLVKLCPVVPCSEIWRGVNFASRVLCHSVLQNIKGFARKLGISLCGEVLVCSLEE